MPQLRVPADLLNTASPPHTGLPSSTILESDSCPQGNPARFILFGKCSKPSLAALHRYGEPRQVASGNSPLEKARSCLTHRVYDQRAIQKEIPCFAARLRDQKTAVACCPVQRSVI